MKLEKLRIVNFRNHKETVLDCSTTINFFVGPNGQGKTNILEAAAYLSLGKSFFSAPDNTLIRIGEDEFVIHGTLLSDDTIEYTVRIRYSKTENKKEIRINGSEQERVSSLIGKFPVVILYPDQHSITNGGPAERRRFIDLVLSQANQNYFEFLVEYKKILRQRNAILSDANKLRGSLNTLLEPWNESLINTAIRIMDYRASFVEEFKQYLLNNYRKIVHEEEAPGIYYKPTIAVDSEMTLDEKKEIARQALEENSRNELISGMTLCGPHRDELLLTLNDLEVRKFASQGQQKSFLVALKVSESQYLLEKRNEQPIILLDDLFGELDSSRAEQVLELTVGMGQTFATSTDDRLFNSRVAHLNGYKKFNIDAGVVASG